MEIIIAKIFCVFLHNFGKYD